MFDVKETVLRGKIFYGIQERRAGDGASCERKGLGEMLSRSIALRCFIVLLVVSPLIIGGLWIYNASAAAFSVQHDIRIAQAARSQLVRIHLAKELDVLGFTATHDPYFAQEYRQDNLAFTASSAKLAKDLLRIDPQYRDVSIIHELELYQAWETNVAQPIISQKRRPTGSVLRNEDHSFSSKLVAEDAKIQAFLNNAASKSEFHRQELLRRILFASIALVIAVASIVVVSFMLHERSVQRQFLLSREIEEEHRITEMLQRSLTPHMLPQTAGLALHAVYVPAAIEHYVGGDWFEAIELSEGRLLCIIGDVAGHGLDAAVIMNQARRSLLAAAVIEDEPARILERANRLFIQIQTRMVTCVIDSRNMTMTYSAAGHPPPVVAMPNQPPFLLPTGAPPLGLFADLECSSSTHVLQKGTCIFLFTDGLIEEDRDLIGGEERILQAVKLAALAPDPASALYQHVIGDKKPKDDVAVLSMSFLGSEPVDN